MCLQHRNVFLVYRGHIIHLFKPQNPKISKNIENTKTFLSHIFVCFPQTLKWTSNVFSLCRIDVISYTYHHYSSHINETTFGLKSVFEVPFWFFSPWGTCKRDHFSLCAKPQHIWHKTNAFYPKRVRLYNRSHSTTSG